MSNCINGVEEWRISSAEFKGYVKATLGEISKQLDRITDLNDNQSNRLNKVENRLTATEIKGGIFGSIGGLIGGLLSGFLRK